MICKKCGAEIPEGKIYCEKCGNAIQMVPDYDPEDDISIETGEEGSPDSDIPEKSESHQENGKSWHVRAGYVLAALLLMVCGGAVYRFAYHSFLQSEPVLEEEEETVLLEEPQFSVAPGTYDYVLQLTISHSDRENGIIYYTTDGTTPSDQSSVYNRPIQIDEGKTIIRAVFIRSDGVQSEEADGTYQIIFDYPEEPVFSVPSGEYEGSFSVTLTTEEDCSIYYTTNGEEPDRYSTRYTGPIEIFPGLTVLQAVAINEEGRESGIMEAIYIVREAEETTEAEIEVQTTE